MDIHGQVWKYGDNIDTDVIIPGRYCNISDPQELAKYALADLDPDFVGKMSPGDLIVAGGNFGCGSSREVAPICIKAAGVSAVIAGSFARIFFRNAINIGLPIFQSAEAAERIREGDDVSVDAASGLITNHTRNESYKSAAFPEFIQDLVAQGGLIPYVQNKLAARKQAPTEPSA